MSFTIDRKPYIHEIRPSGLSVAKCLGTLPNNQTINGQYWKLDPNGESNYHNYLREWLVPLLNDCNSCMFSLSIEPRDLPYAIRQICSNGWLAFLTINTFPKMKQERWKYTTSSLNEIGLATNYRLDKRSDPHNNYSCVPTAIDIACIAKPSYVSSWKDAIEEVKPKRDNTKPNFTGHMMFVIPKKDHDQFLIADQYGLCSVASSILVEMAKVRNSFLGEESHAVQIIIPTNVVKKSNLN